MSVNRLTQEFTEQVYTVPTPCQFRLGNIRGRVEIQAGEDGVIQVAAVKHIDSGDADNTHIDISQRQDGSVCVETLYPGPLGWLFFPLRPCKVDYRVRLPRACSLQVSGVTSSAVIQGFDGKLDFSTVSGALTLINLSGELRIKSVSGEIGGENLSGTLVLETVSGNVHLDSSRFSWLQGSTVSAVLAVQTPLADGPYRFSSVSGDVRLIVPDSTACTLTSQSISGKIVSDLPITRRQEQAGQRRVEVQGGGPEVRHNSISGSLKLFATRGVPEAVPVETLAVPTPEPDAPSFPDRWEILERID